MRVMIIMIVSMFTWMIGSGVLAADVLKPISAHYQGKLQPVYGIDEHIVDNTIVMTQPWAGRNSMELRELAVYFKSNGMADSKLWLNVPWGVRNNQLCLKSAAVNSCYKAYSDQSGQAFLLHLKSNLLVSVEGIEVGDSHGIAAAHRKLQAKKRAELKRQQARARASTAMLGLFAAAMMSGGGSQGSARDCFNETCSGYSRPWSAVPTR